MNGTLLGIGPLEVLFIGILILLVFGPERLPEFTRGLGRALRKLRESYIAFTHEFKDELQPIAADLQEVTRELQQEVQAIREAADLRSVLNPYVEDINRAATIAPTPNGVTTTDGLAAPSVVNGTTVATPTASSVRPSSSHHPLSLPLDNPWASVGASIRTDALDEDNPWRG
ncbi:MAG: twin-arginine translocase TatA/TatE family subunit [Anaerolineae bacterium]|nr:twin-arginine translocase TatA/TatE family subunit [Anaerolineae bacterium]